LEAGSVFVLDSITGIYLWQGKAASALKKKYGSTVADEILKSKKDPHPAWVKVTQVAEGTRKLFYFYFILLLLTTLLLQRG